MNSRQSYSTNGSSRRTPDGRKKFPILGIIALVLAIVVLVYSAVTIIVFVSALRSDNNSAVAATNPVFNDDAEVVEPSNNGVFVKLFSDSEMLTPKTLFNIDDINSFGSHACLYAFCTLLLASLVVIFFSIRSIVKSSLSSAAKVLIVILGIIASLVLGAFATFKLYGAQLTWFKADKADDNSNLSRDVEVDLNGNYYMLDGIGEPILILHIDDDVSTEEYTDVSSALETSDIDDLVVRCDYEKVDDKIKINKFIYQLPDGSDKTLDLKCLATEPVDPIYYQLNEAGHELRYRLVYTSQNIREDPDAVTTFLIVGKDRVALNTDVMILVSLHEEDGKYSADVLQIPRDTYCRDNSSNNKINAVFGTISSACDSAVKEEKIKFGMEGLVSVLERNWLIKIDYWAIMDLDGFGDIVDAIGGVDMYVPFDMEYYDYSAVPPLEINLKEGQQNLNGNQAEQFVRYRKGYSTGDLGRVDATKLFLTAFFCKMREELSITNPSAIASTVNTLTTYMTTNMDPGNTVDYVSKALKLTLEDIKFLNLPGSDYAKAPGSNLSYYTTNRDGMYYVLNTYFNVYDHDINEAEFDASRMFTTSQRNTELDKAHNAYFDVDDYVSSLKGADDIKENQDNGINDLPVNSRVKNK